MREREVHGQLRQAAPHGHGPVRAPAHSREDPPRAAEPHRRRGGAEGRPGPAQRCLARGRHPRPLQPRHRQRRTHHRHRRERRARARDARQRLDAGARARDGAPGAGLAAAGHRRSQGRPGRQVRLVRRSREDHRRGAAPREEDRPAADRQRARGDRDGQLPPAAGRGWALPAGARGQGPEDARRLPARHGLPERAAAQDLRARAHDHEPGLAARAVGRTQAADPGARPAGRAR